MKKLTTICAGLLLIISGGALLAVRTDREFIALPPTPGAANTVPLIAGNTYEQGFIAQEANISRVGVYISPIGTPPPGAITLQVSAGDRVVEQSVSVVFAGNAGPLSADIRPYLTTTPGERVTISVAVPPQLSGTVGINTRQEDGSFGYHVYTSEHPSLTLHIGGLLLIAAVWVLVPHRQLLVTAGYAVALPIVANLPGLLYGKSVYGLIVLQAIVLFVVLHGLKRLAIPIYGRLVAAHIMAFAIWAPLLAWAPLRIVAVGAVAAVAGIGMAHLMKFLGEQKQLTRILMFAITYLTLLEILSMYSRVIGQL